MAHDHPLQRAVVGARGQADRLVGIGVFDRYEMYDMQIYAASQETAEKAGKALCEALGLDLCSVVYKDWR